MTNISELEVVKHLKGIKFHIEESDNVARSVEKFISQSTDEIVKQILNEVSTAVNDHFDMQDASSLEKAKKPHSN
jgi:hypothetical protein